MRKGVGIAFGSHHHGGHGDPRYVGPLGLVGDETPCAYSYICLIESAYLGGRGARFRECEKERGRRCMRVCVSEKRDTRMEGIGEACTFMKLLISVDARF